MDGLLLNSEDIYTLCTNIILHENNRPSLPWSIKAQLQGRPGPAAGAIFEAWAKLPIDHPTYLARLSELQHEHFPHCEPLPGVMDLLKFLRKCSVVLALATSSHKRNFDLKTGHLEEIFAYFPESLRVLGDDPRVKPGRGKPMPDIFLLALECVNEGIRERGVEKEITPEECLVFEDSVPGVEAGRRAGMRVVWCPHPGLLLEYKGREDEVLAGMTGCMEGKAGEIGDGWAELVRSLEDFDGRQYGIKASERL